MRVIPVCATKGGVGKTKVCLGIGRVLKRKGYRVGFLDVDWVAPNLHIELGIDKDPHLVLESGVGDTIHPIVSPEGFPLVSSAFIFPANQAVMMDEESKVNDIIEITSPGVVHWGDLDYLMMDTPPTTARFVQAALAVKDLYGVVLVTQPAASSLADLLRTISLLRELQVPLMGLVGNQVYVVCPHGERINLFEFSEKDIDDFCRVQGVPYLGSIPHVIPSEGYPSLDRIVDEMLSRPPIRLKPQVVSALPYRILLTLARKMKHKDLVT